MKATVFATFLRKRQEGVYHLLGSAFCVFVIVAAVPMILFCTALALMDRYILPFAECLLTPRNRVKFDAGDLDIENFLNGQSDGRPVFSIHDRAVRHGSSKGKPDVFLSS